MPRGLACLSYPRGTIAGVSDSGSEAHGGVVLRMVTTTPAASEMGRLAQLLKAAGLTALTPIAQPSGPQQGTAAEAEELASLGS